MTLDPRPLANAALRDVLASAAPPAIALMRLALASPNEAAFAAAVGAIRQSAKDRRGGQEAERLAALVALADGAPDAWALVRALASVVPHAAREEGSMADRLAELAAAFDRAATLSPAASVALYSLGRPELLDAATADVVGYLETLGVIGPDRALLDIGCGVGRFERALAGKVARIVGLDISPAMVEIARRDCAGLANIDIRLCSGADLSGVADASMDCALAVDAFPYVVLAAGGLPRRLFEEMARVLKPGGDVLIANYSYRADLAADPSDVARLAHLNGLVVLRSDERPFRSWDGRVFHLGKKA
ncbi:MAG TPA: class I SAM-dependent methyltransferase [Roseiarcus sp.]|nr:class I SAM-dependent methyltransferase [Roseiarcus sp.]